MHTTHTHTHTLGLHCTRHTHCNDILDAYDTRYPRACNLRGRRDSRNISRSNEYIESRTIIRTNANRARFDDDGGNEKVNLPTTEEEKNNYVIFYRKENMSRRRARETVCRSLSASIRSNPYPPSFVKNSGKGIERNILLRM